MNVWKIQLITIANYARVREILKEVKKKKRLIILISLQLLQ